jgi:hypothetical protein
MRFQYLVYIIPESALFQCLLGGKIVEGTFCGFVIVFSLTRGDAQVIYAGGAASPVPYVKLKAQVSSRKS